MKIRNRTNDTLEIPVVLVDGTLDSINLQPKSRLTLRDGSAIDPKHVLRLQSKIAVEDATVTPPGPAPTPLPDPRPLVPAPPAK